MISIMCCYNDEKCLNSMLIPSLNNQNCEYELILINNNEKQYKSAAEAYNNEIVSAKGDIIIFSHQDVIIDDSEFLNEVEKIFQQTPEIILGLAGIKNNGKVYSNLRYYKTKEYITMNRITNMLEQVDSIDECFIAIKKDDFMRIKFDENVCDGWHLYGVELCYAAKVLGIKAMVTPLAAYHKLLPGKRVTKDFLKGMSKLCRKYKNKYDVIYAPCYVLNTGFPNKQLKLLRTYIKILLGKNV